MSEKKDMSGKARSKAYTTAVGRLKAENEDRFYTLLCEEYDAAGLGAPRPPASVREAIREAQAEVKRLELIESLKRQLEALEGGVPVKAAS